MAFLRTCTVLLCRRVWCGGGVVLARRPSWVRIRSPRSKRRCERASTPHPLPQLSSSGTRFSPLCGSGLLPVPCRGWLVSASCVSGDEEQRERSRSGSFGRDVRRHWGDVGACSCQGKREEGTGGLSSPDGLCAATFRVGDRTQSVVPARFLVVFGYSLVDPPRALVCTFQCAPPPLIGQEHPAVSGREEKAEGELDSLQKPFRVLASVSAYSCP